METVSPFHLYKEELTIIGIKINPFTFNKALGWIDSMGDRYLDYKRLGIKVFPLKEFKEAIQELKKGSIAKAIFEINQ
uniref:Alcohol dehydrogenase n=1 Tax=Timema douglasi TaxID=61478 RepID=A0A7R8VX34_TIMDO|nr:unnamed protein product [Timema douglasi]